MKSFVTGATGFIGASIVRELLENNHEVRALVRRGSDTSNLSGLDVELIAGDILDPPTFNIGMKGCDTLFHAAADYRLWTLKPEDMYRINVEGTVSVLQGAVNNGISKVVYTSSVGTLGNPGDGSPGDETTPVSFSDMVGHYKKSKFLAEREAEKFAAAGLPLVVVNPSTPVGPMDIKPTPTGKIIVDFLNRKMPAYLDTGLNIIPVEDCARGHLLAAEKGKPGEKYILGNSNVTLHHIFLILSEVTGIPAPKFKLPYFPILVAAYLNEGIAKITEKEPLIPLAGVQMAAKYMYFDASKAIKALGLPQNSIELALRRAVDWFIEKGYVKRNYSSKNA